MKKKVLILLCIIISTISFAGTPITSLADPVFGHYLNFFSVIPTNLNNAAMYLAYFCIIIEVSWYLFKMGFQNANIAELFVKKAIQISVFVWIINNYTYILNSIAALFVKLGQVAAGNMDTSAASNPDLPINIAFQIASIPIHIDFQNTNSTIIITLIATIISVLALLWISLEIMLCWLEFYFLGGISISFVGFGLWERTEFYFEKTINLWIVFGSKLMVITTITGFSISVMANQVLPTLKDEMSLPTSMNLLICTMLLALLSCKVPSLVAGLLTGTSSVSVGSVLGSALGMAKMDVPVASGSSSSTVVHNSAELSSYFNGGVGGTTQNFIVSKNIIEGSKNTNDLDFGSERHGTK